MRFLTMVTVLLLVAATCLMGTTVAQQGPPDDPPGQGGGNKGGQGDNASSSENRTNGPPPHANASQTARDRAEARTADHPGSPRAAWRNALDTVREQPGQQARQEALEHAPEHARANMGLFTVEQTFEGRFVSFDPSEDLLAITNVSVGGDLVFEAIYFPPDDDVSVRHAGNAIHFQGEDWRFHIVDAPPAPITMRTQGEPFQLVLPDQAVWESTRFGGVLDYPDDDLQARVVGLDPRDENVSGLLNVSDSLNFHVSAQRVVLEHVANQQRGALDEALTRKALGGEVTMLRDPEDRRGVFSDVVLFDEMEILVRPNQAIGEVPDNASAHTITVSAEGIPGKTIVVNLEESLVDPEELVIRYYSEVDPDTVQEVPIRMADSLADVLDPESAQGQPKYWIVEDIDGVQLLLLIPDFSTHHIELLGMIDPVKVSLVAGVLGAVLVIALAAVGIVRRPEDEL